MTKQQYQKYLYSAEWLEKKAELISIYKKIKWKIDCMVCKSTYRLHVHHMSYKNIGKEILKDERMLDLSFICADCHGNWHFQDGFKEKWLATPFL